MKHFKLCSLVLVTLVLSSVCVAQHHHSSDNDPEETPSENSKLIDEFGDKMGHCDLTGRFDLFLSELSQNPSSQGYILIYQATDGLPANYDDPPMQRMFRNHLAFRRFDPSRITLVNGGFQEQGRTQLWMVPQGAIPPSPESTLPKPEIPQNKTFLFDRDYLALEEYDAEESEFVLPSVKAEREAERKKWEEEARLERLAAGEEDVEIEPVTEVAEEVQPDEIAEEEPGEEIFSVSESFGTLLGKREESRGVIIFYADDQHFDIGKIRALMEEGIERFSTSSPKEGGRIELVFGGYRSSTDIEYWIVPQKGEQPVPTPQERPVEEPDEGEVEN